METSWNPTEQLVADHRNALTSEARTHRLLKATKSKKRQPRFTHWSAWGRVLDATPEMRMHHPAA